MPRPGCCAWWPPTAVPCGWPTSVTTMVDSLEATGLVARQADPGDRRSVLVALSDEGRRLLDRLDAARRDSAEEVFGGLDGSQRRHLLELLGVLCERGSCVSCCSSGAHHVPAGNGPRGAHRHLRHEAPPGGTPDGKQTRTRRDTQDGKRSGAQDSTRGGTQDSARRGTRNGGDT
jgi:MarR family